MNSDYGSISFNLFLWLFEKSTEESWINSTILFVNFIKIEHICETFLTRIEKERKKLAENAEFRITFSKSSVHFPGSIIKFINWTFRSPKKSTKLYILTIWSFIHFQRYLFPFPSNISTFHYSSISKKRAQQPPNINIVILRILSKLTIVEKKERKKEKCPQDRKQKEKREREREKKKKKKSSLPFLEEENKRGAERRASWIIEQTDVMRWKGPTVAVLT